MLQVKSQDEIEKMKKSGQITTKALKTVLENIKPGISTIELDKIAEKTISKLGGSASFKTVASYNHTICTTVNDEVVHGVPTNYKLKSGDIVGIDIGAVFDGYHTDMAETVAVGEVDSKTLKFLQVGKKALFEAIKRAKDSNFSGDISSRMQQIVEKAGYSVVRELTGHGIGKSLHEEPTIPCYGKEKTGQMLKSQMTLAIEVIYTAGSEKIRYKNDDGWTIATIDGSLGGLFERSILVTKVDPIVLTPLD